MHAAKLIPIYRRDPAHPQSAVCQACGVRQFALFGGELLLVPANVEGAPVLRRRRGLEVDYVAGYGSEAADVPTDLRQAMLALVAYWHANRDAVIVAGSGAVVPSGFERMIAPYRRVRL